MSQGWDRLKEVIAWANKNTNSFSKAIELKHPENLYRIRRGYNGISKKLAERITAKYPQINKTWLLTGDGSMLTGLPNTTIPLYDSNVLEILNQDEKPQGDIKLQIASVDTDCIAILSSGSALEPLISKDAIVFLKETDPAYFIPGKVYAVCTEDFYLIRYVEPEESGNTLKLYDTHRKFILMDRDSISKAYVVEYVLNSLT